MSADDRNYEFEPLPEDLAEVAELLALGPSDVVDEQPPPSVWAGIEAELRATPQQPDVHPVDDGSTLLRQSPVDPVVDLAEERSKRRFRSALAAGAVAAVLLVGVPIALALRESTSDGGAVTATADLSAVPDDFGGSGAAELVDGGLRVETMGLDPLDDAVYELWLLELVDGQAKDLVSLGLIDADGTYELDDGIDLDRFSTVDISIEPTDGDPTHSGNSVLRGELETR